MWRCFWHSGPEGGSAGQGLIECPGMKRHVDPTVGNQQWRKGQLRSDASERVIAQPSAKRLGFPNALAQWLEYVWAVVEHGSVASPFSEISRAPESRCGRGHLMLTCSVVVRRRMSTAPSFVGPGVGCFSCPLERCLPGVQQCFPQLVRVPEMHQGTADSTRRWIRQSLSDSAG